MSITLPAALEPGAADSESQPAARSAFDTAFAVLFAATAVLLVSFIVVMTGLI